MWALTILLLAPVSLLILLGVPVGPAAVAIVIVFVALTAAAKGKK